MNVQNPVQNQALVENLLARACEDLCGLYRCVDEGRWGGVHTHAAGAIKLALCACLAAKGRVSEDDVWQTFRQQYPSAFSQMSPALLQIAGLRKSAEASRCSGAEWESTREHVRRVLVAMVGVLPKQSIGRTRLNMAAQLLAWERPQESAMPRRMPQPRAAIEGSARLH